MVETIIRIGRLSLCKIIIKNNNYIISGCEWKSTETLDTYFELETLEFFGFSLDLFFFSDLETFFVDDIQSYTHYLPNNCVMLNKCQFVVVLLEAHMHLLCPNYIINFKFEING